QPKRLLANTTSCSSASSSHGVGWRGTGWLVVAGDSPAEASAASNNRQNPALRGISRQCMATTSRNRKVSETRRDGTVFREIREGGFGGQPIGRRKLNPPSTVRHAPVM